MQIRVIIPFERIEAAINAEYQELLIPQVKNDITQFLTEVDIQKETPIRIRSKKNQLLSELTIRAKVKLKRKGIAFASLLPELEQLQFSLKVEVLTHIRLVDEWRLRSQSEIAYKWMERPSMMGGLLPIPLTSILEPILDRQLQSVAQDIDRYIQSISLQEAITTGWDFLKQPLEVEEAENEVVSGNFSFGVMQSRIGCGLPEMKERELQMALEIPTEMFFSSDPIRDVDDPGPIPSPSNWILHREMQNEIEVFFSWHRIQEILQELKIEEAGGLQIQLSDVEVKGGAEGIDIQSHVKGRWKGWPFSGKLVLEGVPKEDGRKLSWEALTLSLPQKSATLQVADTVQRGKLVARLQSYISSWLPEASLNWGNEIKEKLASWDLDSRMNLKSPELDWYIRDVETTKEGIWVMTVWKGDVCLEIKEWEAQSV